MTDKDRREGINPHRRVLAKAQLGVQGGGKRQKRK